MFDKLRNRAIAALLAICVAGIAPAAGYADPAGALSEPDVSAGLVSGSKTDDDATIVQFMATGTGTHVVNVSALNVRTGPGANYSVASRLYRGNRVQVVALDGDYCRILAQSGDYGYVMRQYLDPASVATPTPAPTASVGRQVYRITASALNVRIGPDTGYSVLTQLSAGAQVYKLADVNATWMRVQLVDGRYGYIMSRYAAYQYTLDGSATPTPTPRPTTAPESTPASTPETTAGLGPGLIYAATANVNLRSGPSNVSGVKKVIVNGQYVTLISKFSSVWYYVRTQDGIYGYVNQQYLSYRYTASGTSTPQPSSGIVDTSEKVYSYEQMKSDISRLYDKYPNMVTRRVSIGDTMLKSEQIIAVCIGNPNASKALLIDAGIHGREYMSTLLAMRQMEYVLDNQSATIGGRAYASLLNDCCIWFVPMINPDGVRISQTGLIGMNATEKNNLIALNGGSTYFERWKANGYGVDLNRNFSAGWTYQGKPSSTDYSGSYADSESETRAIENFVRSHSNIRAGINYHTTGNCIYWHFGQRGNPLSRDRSIASKLSSLTGFYLRDTNYTGKGGGFMDWMISSCGLPSFTIELGPGNLDAPQEISQFSKIWNSTRGVAMYMVDYIVNYL